MVRKLQFGLVSKSLPSTNFLKGLMTSQYNIIKKSSTSSYNKMGILS